MTPTAPVWVGVSLEDFGRIESIRDRLWRMADGPDGYKKVRPHVTVYPRMRMPGGWGPDLLDAAAPLVGDEVRVEGIGFYPGPERPAVVLLDVDADLGDARDRISEMVDDAGGSEVISPVPPHVTLFKAGDSDDWDDSDALIGGRFVEKYGGRFGGWTTRISDAWVRRPSREKVVRP